MSRIRFRAANVAAAVLVVTPLALTTTSGPASSTQGKHDQERAQVVLDWERILFQTLYPLPTSPIPTRVPILGFTSLAMYDAASTSAHRGRSSEAAAVATAAHDVLVHYVSELGKLVPPPTDLNVPAVTAALDAELDDSLATVSDARALAKGSRLGHEAAARMIRSRTGDGLNDPSIHYALPPGIGIWRPNPGTTDMVAPWLGSLRQLMVDPHSPIDGPDPLNSAAYVADYNQVKRIGRANAPLSDRSASETATALFFNANSATMVGDALIRRLEARGMDLLSTAWTFAAMHASMTDSAIQCWRLKRDLGYLRPHEAITGSVDDGNPATVVEAGWTPLVTPVPNYADYVSGHACLTSPQIGVIREVLGEDTALELRSANGPPRVYTKLAHIEHDAYYARIWSGLHFADAMDDGYLIGHDTAARVMAALPSR